MQPTGRTRAIRSGQIGEFFTNHYSLAGHRHYGQGHEKNQQHYLTRLHIFLLGKVFRRTRLYADIGRMSNPMFPARSGADRSSIKSVIPLLRFLSFCSRQRWKRLANRDRLSDTTGEILRCVWLRHRRREQSDNTLCHPERSEGSQPDEILRSAQNDIKILHQPGSRRSSRHTESLAVEPWRVLRTSARMSRLKTLARSPQLSEPIWDGTEGNAPWVALGLASGAEPGADLRVDRWTAARAERGIVPGSARRVAQGA
jgi:hypothetical protein